MKLPLFISPALSFPASAGKAEDVKTVGRYIIHLCQPERKFRLWYFQPWSIPAVTNPESSMAEMARVFIGRTILYAKIAKSTEWLSHSRIKKTADFREIV